MTNLVVTVLLTTNWFTYRVDRMACGQEMHHQFAVIQAGGGPLVYQPNIKRSVQVPTSK